MNSPAEKIFLTDSQADKEAYIRMMSEAVRAAVDAMSHSQAYAGMPPYELRDVIRKSEILPVNGIGIRL